MNEHAFIVNKNSWHYRWLCFYRSCLDSDFRSSRRDAVTWSELFHIRPYDFCQYWRMALLWPLIRIGLNVALYVGAAFVLMQMSSDGAFAVGAGLLGLASTGAFFGALYLVLLAIGWLAKKVFANSGNAASPSIFKTAHAAWKGKFCPTLEYEKGSE